mgnify:CR=1 FL=1
MALAALSVLIVDDHPHMRSILHQVVKSAGVERIHLAKDSAEALRIIHDQDIDILITDLVMEPLDGIDLVRLIRRSPDSTKPLLPILMVTGHMTLSRIQEARDAGVNEFAAKPISVKAVLERLAAIIDRPRDFIRAEEYFGPDRRRRKSPEETKPQRRKSDPQP